VNTLFFVQIFRVIFFKAIGIQFSIEAKEGDDHVRVVSRAALFGWCRVSRRARAGFGFKFVKMFRDDFGPVHNFFTTLGVTIFFVYDAHSFCSLG